jgi:DNA-binding GntR family transcriptional regulator
MYDALNAHIKIARVHAADAQWPRRLREEQAEHEAIVSALEARDASAASAALRHHIYRAKDSLVAALESRAAAQEPQA